MAANKARNHDTGRNGIERPKNRTAAIIGDGVCLFALVSLAVTLRGHWPADPAITSALQLGGFLAIWFCLLLLVDLATGLVFESRHAARALTFAGVILSATSIIIDRLG